MHLLLDFDGVILRNHPAHKLIVHRCERFVSRFYPHLSRSEVKNINKTAYELRGHTLLGLRELTNVNITIDDFNRSVYAGIDYRDIFRNVQKTHLDDIKKYKKILDVCREKGVGVRIFSNAPSTWCENAQHSMGIDDIVSDLYKSITSLHVKPEPITYHMVDAMIQDDKYIFVDDKHINLKPIKYDEQWTGIHGDLDTLLDIIERDGFFGKE